jgi:hypothetical protein
MTTEATKATEARPASFYATTEDRDRIAAIAEMLRRRGHRSSASAAISYALHRVFLAECSADGSKISERNAA